MVISAQELQDFKNLKRKTPLFEKNTANEEQETSKKNLRKKQLKIGKVILDFFEESDSPTKPIREKQQTRKVGRPKKIDSEKVQNISIKLPPLYIDYLKNLKFGRGIGTRIRKIIDSFQEYQRREKEQVRAVKQLLARLENYLGKYSNQFSRSEKIENNELLLSELNKIVGDIKIMFNLLHIKLPDYQEILTAQEFKNLEFAVQFYENRTISDDNK